MPFKKVIQNLTFASLATLPLSVFAGEYLPAQASSSFEQAPEVSIYKAKQPFPGVLTGGQPTQSELEQAKKLGYKTIINLRMPNEMTEWNEASKVQSLDMKYVSIPVSSRDSINSINSDKMISILQNKSNYPVMIHCGSGNRVGALFSVDAFFQKSLSQEDALAIGRQAGMTKLEPLVTSIFNQAN